MTLSPEILQAIIAGLVTGVIGSFGWLSARLWQLYRHEIRDMKHTDKVTSVTLAHHLDRDEVIHRELTGVLGEVRGLLAAQQIRQRSEA